MTHDELGESAAAYALGALDERERSAFETHLRDCALCREEVASLQAAASELALAAPTRSMAPTRRDAVRARLLQRARAGRSGEQAGAFPALRLEPSSDARRRRAWTLPWLAAAACLLVAIGSAAAYASVRAERARLAGELAATRARLARDDSALSAFFGPEVHVVSLTAPRQAKPSLRVFWNHTRRTFIVTAHALPPAPPGKTYQLWAMPKGKAPVSMGTFAVGADGRALALLPVSDLIQDSGFIDDCGLTIEPAGGSPQPTESPRLIGAWRHVD